MTPLSVLLRRLRSGQGIGRRIGRRIELGAGVAALILALLGLALLLFAPLVAACAVATHPCPPRAVRYESLLRARLDAAAWAFALAPVVLALLGAAGAVADAVSELRLGVAALGIATGLAVLLCLLGAAGIVALSYLPATLALALAAYGAYLRRAEHRTKAPQ